MEYGFLFPTNFGKMPHRKMFTFDEIYYRLKYSEESPCIRHTELIFQILTSTLPSIKFGSPLNLKLWNYGKCCVMSLTNKNQKICFDYAASTSLLLRVDSFKDLGIIFDAKLTFSYHIGNIMTDAWKNLGFITRPSSCFTDIRTVCSLYSDFVRSKLEYATSCGLRHFKFMLMLLKKCRGSFWSF